MQEMVCAAPVKREFVVILSIRRNSSLGFDSIESSNFNGFREWYKTIADQTGREPR